NGAAARQRQQRHHKSAAEAERDHQCAQVSRGAEAAQQKREDLLHDLEVQELLEDGLHQALFHAKRVSIQRPTATTGMNRTIYATAPIMRGVALPVKDWAVVAWFRISPTPITVPR